VNERGDQRHIVESGYDRMAEGYLRSRDENDPAIVSALEEFAGYLPEAGKVLDLGCGAGIPVTRWLTLRRFAVTGIDVSARQLELAREHVPEATFIKADMGEVEFPPGSFDGVVSFYAIIHVPREEHAALIERIARWLKPGGAFQATWPLTEWEGEEENWEGWGATMWWSHYGAETYQRLLNESGYSITSAGVRTTGTEQWMFVLANRA
jgi:2-polyprenyl-3-methyl-5-hydroxy-6-metoxy-1,4-benzoquinol methylase